MTGARRGLFTRIPSNEWVYGYRYQGPDRTIEVLRIYSGEWTVFVDTPLPDGHHRIETRGEQVPFIRAMGIACNLVP